MRGAVRLRAGDLAGAREDLTESLAMFADDRDVSGVVLHLMDFAALALGAGEPERALRLAGAATALQAASGTGMLEFAQNQVEGLGAAAERLGRERAEALLAEGRADAHGPGRGLCAGGRRAVPGGQRHVRRRAGPSRLPPRGRHATLPKEDT